ncbi:MAG: hypothetical protein HC936_13480 [Leptolyngbyaceae cyanobacterium SU_3_3]|nr:hypothetical protein [Leptolyngbyaceae cyanobacterium SU_3_3]NJR50158.1 hypothetical protein [Leptolyngbyaceae cyanobacterium CSU_1_3]
MQFRALVIVILSACMWILGGLYAPDAFALTQIKLSNLSYHECPTEVGAGTVSSGATSRAANCFIVTGKAENPTNKPVVNADIFGRIYDANNDSVMQNRTRLGSIESVPPGISDFELRITVAANQPTPLKLEQFKAAGFTGKVRR